MNPDDFPAPNGGIILTHFLVVSDQDRSREFSQSLLGGQVLLERDPVIMRVANTSSPPRSVHGGVHGRDAASRKVASRGPVSGR
jgi:hypothetical protein